MTKAHKPRLYVANVRSRDYEMPAVAPGIRYAVLASTPGDAVRAIRKEYGYECTVQFSNDHGLKEVDTIKRLGLEDGRAKSVT